MAAYNKGAERATERRPEKRMNLDDGERHKSANARALHAKKKRILELRE